MNKVARNERIKLTATWLNGAGVAALAVGCFAPIVAFITSQAHVPVGELNWLVAGWLFISVSLHLAARIVLGRIEE